VKNYWQSKVIPAGYMPSLEVIGALWDVEGTWFADLAERGDLWEEDINLLATHPESLVRWNIARRQSPVRRASYEALIHLFGDSHVMVAKAAQDSLEERDFALEPFNTGKALRLADSEEWLVWPDHKGWKNRDAALPSFVLSAEFMTTHPLLFRAIEQGYELLVQRGDPKTWNFDTLPLARYKGRVKPFEGIKASYGPSPTAPVEGKLRMEARVGSKRYQLWSAPAGKLLGWTELDECKPSQTLDPRDWFDKDRHYGETNLDLEHLMSELPRVFRGIGGASLTL
jgi:hypothetical protein